uniref:Protein lingerer n=1 Tax=Timema douglasi TaxID=61478 RepID=A0A7R8Z567_TIMDO|nr:unnamed protein product [Timema douglasi]
MSSVGRSASRGGKGGKLDACTTSKPQKADSKSDSPKGLDPKIQPTAEQMRIAQIIDTRTEDPDLKDKIKQVMDATRKTEDEVCTALHDCDNDLDRAVNMLLEGMGQGEWETSVKKKKNRQPSTTKCESSVNNLEAEQDDWAQDRGGNSDRDRSRTRGGGPPRMRGRGGLDNRGWRGRENKENERNLDEGRDGYRRGGGRMMNGPGRGRGGRGGGRLGPRTFQSREKGGFSRPIETWTGSEDTSGESLKMENLGNEFSSTEDWDIETIPGSGTNVGTGNVSDKWGDDFPSPEDWDNEEYTGSLADSKVFTSSGGTMEPVPTNEPLVDLAAQNLSSSVASSSSQMSQSIDIHQAQSQLSQSPIQVGMGTLSAAQSEYLNQLAQASESLKSAGGLSSSSASVSVYGTTSAGYPTTSSTVYQPPSPPSGFAATSGDEGNTVTTKQLALGRKFGTTALEASFSTSNYVSPVNSYGSQLTNQIQEQSMETSSIPVQMPVQSMPSRTKTQRPRVPPPSKIPSSAVEMPGDAVNSISYLDVQFGGLEFGSETIFESTVEQQSKYQSNVSGSVLDSIPSPRGSSNLGDLSGSNQTSIDAYSSSTQKPNQSLSLTLSQNQKLSSTDTMLPVTEQKPSQQQSYSQPRVSASGGLDMDKSEVTASTTVYPANQVALSYTSSGSGSGYNPQTVAPSSFQSNSYSQASAGVAYQTGPSSYPSISQTGNSFSTMTPSYQGSTGQSVYGASTLGNTGYVAAAVSNPYQNSYGPSVATTVQNHTKLTSSLNAGTKESQYDTATTSSSNLSTNVTTNSGLSSNVNASPALGLSSTSQNANTTSTKVTSSAGVAHSSVMFSHPAGKSSVVPNIPPGVPPMMGTHQYIMSQGGLPYFQQPVYTYEDLQLVQQRIPHMQAGYYDMGFQAPTSLATGREGLASVAYSMSDGRFTRADNNASPVPSTIPQQNATQAHQQPMLNATTLPPGYAYFYGGGMVPGSFQYGTPAIYPMAPATNTHGSTTSTQYPKPGSYGSGYSTGYEGLSQNQDYGKTSYVSGNQTQNKTGVGANAGTTGSSATDLTGSMYGKSHVALGKVNSYEKQAFHSGTPPPFNMAGSQSTPMAPSGAYAQHMFIPVPAHQQHHSTPLMHQPLHQMEIRNPGRRSESGSSTNQRSQSSSQPNKSGAKQGYSPSYWTPN